MHPVPIAPNLHRPSTGSARLVVRTSKNWVLPPRPRPNRRNTIHSGANSSHTHTNNTHTNNAGNASSATTAVNSAATSAASTPAPPKRKRENSLPVNLKKVKKDYNRVENCLAFLKFDDEEDTTTTSTDIDDDLFSNTSPVSSTCTPLTSASLNLKSVPFNGASAVSGVGMLNLSAGKNGAQKKQQRAKSAQYSYKPSSKDDSKYGNESTLDGDLDLEMEMSMNLDDNINATSFTTATESKPEFFTINNITNATTSASPALNDPVTTDSSLSAKELEDFYNYIPPSLEELIDEQDAHSKNNNGLFRDSLMSKSYESMNLMMFNDPSNTAIQQDDLIVDTDGDMFAFI